MSLVAIGLGAGITIIMGGIGAGVGSAVKEENSIYYGLGVGAGIGLLFSAGILYLDNQGGVKQLLTERHNRRMAKRARREAERLEIQKEVRQNPMYNAGRGYPFGVY